MIKRISWLSPLTVLGAIGLVAMLFCIAEAGTYKLEYPAGYGCNCKPSPWNYGKFETQWRQWPGEVRLDQQHPRAIGATPLPPTKGYEELPLPRKKIQDLQPSTAPETERQAPDSNEQPGGPGIIPGGPAIPGGPTIPGGETLPGLKPEPGGLNPSPGLPPDFNLPGILDKTEKQPNELPKETPPSLEKKDNPPTDQPKDTKDNAKPGVGGLKFKSDSPKKVGARQPAIHRDDQTSDFKNNVPMRLPDTAPANSTAENSPPTNETHLQANWNATLQPGMYAETFRSGTIYPSTDMAKQANYQAPAESNGTGRMPNEVVQQSFQQAQPSAGKIAAPPIALKGYCPVELSHSGRWVQGDPRWTVIHQGVTYRLSGNEQRLQFLAHPEQFAPANEGNDLVLSVNEKRSVPGELSYCAAFQGRIYMFSSATTQKEFQQNPERFINSQNQSSESSDLNYNSRVVREPQTLGRAYNAQRAGF
jgi:YHS domain-containing protein